MDTPVLLHPPVMISSARVVSGAGRGKRLGIPTLNIEMASAPKELKYGIYACTVSFDGNTYKGAMHFGSRPVFRDTDSLEVHVIDERIEKTPESVDIEVIAFLRPVRNYANTEELKAAIDQDISAARGILSA